MHCYFCHTELKEQRLRPPKRGSDDDITVSVYCNKHASQVRHIFIREYESLDSVYLKVEIKDRRYTVHLNIPFKSCNILEEYDDQTIYASAASILAFNHLPSITPENAPEKLKLLLLFT